MVPVASKVTESVEHKVSLGNPEVKVITGRAAASTVTVTVFEAPIPKSVGHCTPLTVAYTILR